MATQQLRNLAVQETADPEGVVWNELDLAPDSWCCFLQVELDEHSLRTVSYTHLDVYKRQAVD